MRDCKEQTQMKHTFTRKQVKRIILEELEKSKVDDAAEEIVDELEGMLSEAEDDSALKRIYNKIFKKAEEANNGEVIVAAEDQEIVEDVKQNGGQAILTKNDHKT